MWFPNVIHDGNRVLLNGNDLPGSNVAAAETMPDGTMEKDTSLAPPTLIV